MCVIETKLRESLEEPQVYICQKVGERTILYLEGFYKSFIAAQPLSSFPERDIIKSVGLSNKYDDKYWITMYMKIRQSEVLDKLTESEFNKRLKEIRTYNVDTAAYYVNRSFLGKLAPTIIKS